MIGGGGRFAPPPNRMCDSPEPNGVRVIFAVGLMYLVNCMRLSVCCILFAYFCAMYESWCRRVCVCMNIFVSL